MIRSSFAVAIGATLAAGLSAAPPAFGQEETDQRFGTVHFATSCNETAQRRFDRAMRYQHSFWYQRPGRYSRTCIKADPECGIAYWGIALSLLFNPHAPPPAPNLPLGLAAIQKGKRSAPRPSASAITSMRLPSCTPTTTRFPMVRASRPISRPWKRWRALSRRR